MHNNIFSTKINSIEMKSFRGARTRAEINAI